MAVGMAMARQMMNQTGGLLAQSTPGVQAAPATAPTPIPELYSPLQVAQMLRVAEADVMASLEAGELEGRKIGTQWRIPHAAIEAFLRA
jgi:excisionase family DNA binding protein